MSTETFQPIAVAPPSRNPLLFRIRCLVDLQLGSIVRFLRPAIGRLHGDVLDLGSGQSPWREWLPPGCVYHGVDVANADEFGMAPQVPDVTYYDGEIIPFGDARFDGAMCIEVLEHVPDPGAFLREAARVLKAGAPLLLSVPWSARRHHIPHDYHRFTREQLERMLRAQGFEKVEIEERGNDIFTIASKLVVVTIRVLKPRGVLDAVLLLPMLVLLVPATLVALIAAHASAALGRGAKEDPLGYFVRAVRASAG